MSTIRMVRWGVCLAALVFFARGTVAEEKAAPAAGTETATKSPAEKQYEERAAKLTDKDAKGWVALADFCEAQLLFKEREEALRKAISIMPDHPEAHRRLDEVKVAGEWMPAADADARAAKDHGAKNEIYYGKTWVSLKAVDRLRAPDRQQFGWEVQTRVDGKFCTVYSAAPFEDTQAVSAVIESTAAAYQATYGKVRKISLAKPIPVHLFNTVDTFLAGTKRMAKTATEIPKGFAGQYSPVAKMLFMSTDIGSKNWTRETMLQCAAHEFTHALDDLAANMQGNSIPGWISEGRARYAQYSVVGRQCLPGALKLPPTDGEGQLVEKEYKTASLATLLGWDLRSFQQNQAQGYPVAWSFTHFLLHGEDGKHRDRFLKFVGGCPQASSAANFQSTVGKTADLEGPYRTYVETVFLSSLKASQPSKPAAAPAETK